MWQEWLQKGLQYVLNLVGRLARRVGQVVWEDFEEPLRKALTEVLTPKWVVTLKEKRQQREQERRRIVEEAAERRLTSLISGETSHFQPVLTFSELYKSVKPPSPEWLAFAATTFMEFGWRRVFRVKSPTNPSFYTDYASLEQIPDELFDEKSHKPFEVDLSLISVVFKRAAE